MDQGKLFWPNFWYKEPWDKFDLGFLPGKKWRDMWQSSTWFKSALPKYGIITGGWPKTQIIKEKFNKNKTKQQKFKILYAPCFENDDKGLDVINSIKNLDVIIEIKHLPQIDILGFGFPCNDFSNVGETEGLDGKFGGLYKYDGEKIAKIANGVFTSLQIFS